MSKLRRVVTDGAFPGTAMRGILRNMGYSLR